MRIVLTPRRTSTVIDTKRIVAPAQAGRGATIAPANLQAVLDSAANAARKGQAQWHTPAEWGEALAKALPPYRPVVVDLTCGNGQLLAGAAAPGTYHQIGCDIEDSDKAGPGGEHFIHADVTLLARYLHEADWQADCFTLNAPFDLHWYRDRLAFLETSNCAAVAAAFCRHDGRTTKDTIDSTVALLSLALDRCSPWGEGFIITNNATAERLLFAPDAPHAALSAHVWCRLIIDGNICTPGSAGVPPADGKSGSDFQTSVLYFARGHRAGITKEMHLGSLAEAAVRVPEIGKSRVAYRAGSVIRQYEGGHTENTAKLWDAIGLEWRTEQGKNRANDLPWNIWLNADGTIETNLTPFQEAAEPVKKQQYVRLNALRGKHPMQLILQVAERKELERAVFGPGGNGDSIWRVAPAVVEAVQAALDEYNEVRSPLYPLSVIQRLGYLDENDDIVCTKSLNNSFTAGRRYAIRTQTLSIKRRGDKVNLTGGRDAVEWEGSELALFIKDNDGIERLFMDEKLKGRDVRLSIQKENEPSPIEYNLQDIADHFEIPEVPDVAAKHPEEYQRYLHLLTQIEEIVNN